MARSIAYLQPGAKLKDSTGQTYVLIAQNHYADGQATVWTENCTLNMKYSDIVQGYLNYEYSDINAYLKNTFPNTLGHTIKHCTVPTKISYTDIASSTITEHKTLEVKYFLTSTNIV